MSKKAARTKHRADVDTALRNLSKPGIKTKTTPAKGKEFLNVDPALKEQYNVIKQDLLKLREDLSRGYDMAKSTVEKKGFIRELLTSK